MRRISAGPALLAIAVLIAGPLRAELIDGVVAIVGSEAITLSEVGEEIRLQAMLNREEPELASDLGRDVLRMLVDRRLVQLDLALTPFLAAEVSDVEAALRQLREDTFLGGRSFAAALGHYGLTDGTVREYLRQRASFERYVAFRFKTGLRIDQDEIERRYWDEYVPARSERGLAPEALESVSASLEDELAEEQANELLEVRLQELRLLHRIVVLGLPSGSGT
ncbi:MAG: hypothetical protein OXN89_12805 [Bryobacterales bacterium]|nr:hypothetical protein [Bryobacterales bacterium]